jgi:hypothetical protein
MKSMDQVLVEIEQIENWERNAQLLNVDPQTLAAIGAMKRNALVVQRQIDANTNIRKRRDAAWATATRGALDWLQAELTQLAAAFQDGNAITAGVREAVANQGGVSLNQFRGGPAIELWVKNRLETIQREHVLRFSVCSRMRVTVTSHVVTGQAPSMHVPPSEPEDLELMLLPSYAGMSSGSNPGHQPTWQYFRVDGGMFIPPAPARGHIAVSLPRRVPQQPPQIIAVQFATSQWPAIAERFPEMLKLVFRIFVATMNGGPMAIS